MVTKDATLRAMGQKSTTVNESIFRRQDNPTLVFVLTLLFLMGGLSQFLTSLEFNTNLDAQMDSKSSRSLCGGCSSTRNWRTGLNIVTAFLFAWGSVSFHTARLVGLIVLGLNLASLGLRRVEELVFWLLLFAITGKHILRRLSHSITSCAWLNSDDRCNQRPCDRHSNGFVGTFFSRVSLWVLIPC